VNNGITAVAVTGTLTPDAVGSYNLSGTARGFNVYIRTDGAYILFNTSTAWGVMEFGPVATRYWTFASVATSPAGSYTAAGTATGTATVALSTSATWASIKEVIAVSRSTGDGFLLPLDFTRSDIVIERDRYEREMSDEWEPYNRYPSDAQTLNRGANGSVIQRGRTLYVYPVPEDSTTDFDVTLECYGRLADYTAASLLDTEPTDFFVEFGSTYMQWAIICELNYLFKTYVNRTEGNLTAPEQARETAWRNLLLWDTYMVDANSTRSR